MPRLATSTLGSVSERLAGVCLLIARIVKAVLAAPLEALFGPIERIYRQRDNRSRVRRGLRPIVPSELPGELIAVAPLRIIGSDYPGRGMSRLPAGSDDWGCVDHPEWGGWDMPIEEIDPDDMDTWLAGSVQAHAVLHGVELRRA